MKSLLEYILEKRVVTFDGLSNSNFGQCLILAGGPGSGKGTMKNSKIVGSFKSFDVDELKKLYMDMQKAGKIDDPNEYDLKNPEDVSKLHTLVKSRGWKKKQRQNWWGERSKTNPRRLPNVLFDMVSDNPDDIIDVIMYAKPLGYKINLAWVVSNIDIARQANKNRPRTVPDDVLEKGHEKCYDCMMNLFNNKWPALSNDIDNGWVIFSPGYHRKYDGPFVKDQVLKIEKTNDGLFDFKTSDKELIDKFLDSIMPIDNDAIKHEEEQKRIKQDLERKKQQQYDDD